MARKLRVNIQGIARHIIQRGNNRQACFFSDADRLRYLEEMYKAAAASGCMVHAWVLMTNHVHLLVTPLTEAGASLMMQALGRSYVRYFNAVHQRSGTLWEGRFKACVVGSERYVLACYRYIEGNPVRAGMAETALAYRWPSCAHNCGQRIDQNVQPHPAYLGLGHDLAACQRQYRALLELEPTEEGELRTALNHNLVLGGEYLAGLDEETATRCRPAKRGRPRKQSV